jgi:hypothetical protein
VVDLIPSVLSFYSQIDIDEQCTYSRNLHVYYDNRVSFAISIFLLFYCSEINLFHRRLSYVIAKEKDYFIIKTLRATLNGFRVSLHSSVVGLLGYGLNLFSSRESLNGSMLSLHGCGLSLNGCRVNLHGSMMSLHSSMMSLYSTRVSLQGHRVSLRASKVNLHSSLVSHYGTRTLG